MTVPVVAMPNPWKMMLQLLRGHDALPAALRDKVAERLPDDFPEGLPFLHVLQVPGGRANAQIGLATVLFDLHVYADELFDAMELGRQVAAVVPALELRSTAEGGFTVVRLVDMPFPFQDPDTGAESAIVPVSATYRPV